HPAATPLGSLTLAEAPLIDAENLFRQPGTTSTDAVGNVTTNTFDVRSRLLDSSYQFYIRAS
ncbi:MAG TPA: hypothetical protein VJ255_15225, partial [Candidatus Acidoferrum sp.]|nr:hypothetical protein [Candidatus Acidoferrum sp.]